MSKLEFNEDPTLVKFEGCPENMEAAGEGGRVDKEIWLEAGDRVTDIVIEY